MINLWAMEKTNPRRFLRIGSACFIILFFLSFFNISYIYAGKEVSISNEAENYRIKGYEAQQRGDIDTAIEWYQKAVSLSPDYASPHNDLGILFETKGWLDRAEAEYQKALSINAEYKEVHTNLALLYERKGELEKAAFHWMRRYKLGKPNDPWTQEAKSRLEKLGLLDKKEKPAASKKIEPQPPTKEAVEKENQAEVKKEAPPVKARAEKKQKSKTSPKKSSDWARVGSRKDNRQEQAEAKKQKSNKSMDRELQESLRLAEERLKKEKEDGGDSRALTNSEASTAYSKAKDYYNKGEYAKALDTIRIAKQDSPGNKSLMNLEDEIKFKMKEERIEDHYKEGIIHYRQKDFTGARKEFEAILSILPD